MPLDQLQVIGVEEEHAIKVSLRRRPRIPVRQLNADFCPVQLGAGIAAVPLPE
jgi:hypothetical protein